MISDADLCAQRFALCSRQGCRLLFFNQRLIIQGRFFSVDAHWNGPQSMYAHIISIRMLGKKLLQHLQTFIFNWIAILVTTKQKFPFCMLFGEHAQLRAHIFVTKCFLDARLRTRVFVRSWFRTVLERLRNDVNGDGDGLRWLEWDPHPCWNPLRAARTTWNGAVLLGAVFIANVSIQKRDKPWTPNHFLHTYAVRLSTSLRITTRHNADYTQQQGH